MTKEIRTIDNQVFLFGLDDIYRERMKAHEKDELLGLARQITSELELQVKDVPIEGYYSEDDDLKEYFRLIKTLQNTPITRKTDIRSIVSYNRLKKVAESPLFGSPDNSMYLISQCDDMLSITLKDTPVSGWNKQDLVHKAFVFAKESEDYSLVTLAALANDPAVLAALRETAVLYAVAVAGCAPITEFEYQWKVDEVLEKRANKFITTFNALFGESLPEAIWNNAESFWNSCNKWKLNGRCVRIGCDDSQLPIRHYHWAIENGPSGLEVKEFWDTNIWTTEMYRKKLGIFSL
jgi:hypothetical protein